MSSIITSILSSTIGLLWNKALDTTADKLKDGDVTDAKIRKLVVRELNDIKTKLDGLLRKDLLTSYSFLLEGVDLLNSSLDKSELEQIALLNEAQDDRGEASRMSSDGTSSIFKEALELSDAMRKVKINSEKAFESARKRFEKARETATHAFSNEALSIQDRIFAAKVRIISEILEHLESPETAITGCLSFLKQLHSLPAIQVTFSVYLNGGPRSLLNKAERVENVKSIMLINQVLSDYCSKFGSEKISCMVWPAIELDAKKAERSFNPLLSWHDVSTRKSMGNELIQPLNTLILDDIIHPFFSAVNGQGLIVAASGREEIKLISKTGETKVVKLPDSTEGEVILPFIDGLAVDNNNNIYLVRRVEKRTENHEVKSYALDVLDGDYTVKHTCTLDFLQVDGRYVTIAINKNNDVIMIKCAGRYVYVCDNTGNVKHKFERHLPSSFVGGLSINEKNEIMVSEMFGQAVLIYTEDGSLRLTLRVPEGHTVRKAAFHHVLCKIIVLTKIDKLDSYFLLCFSETGELENSTFVCKDERTWPAIRSYPSGPVALVGKRSITFI